MFVLLVLKTHQCKDYRSVVSLRKDVSQLVKDLGLKSVPHFTTLHKASEQLLEQVVSKRIIVPT